MKRTELRRRTPLERGKTLARATALPVRGEVKGRWEMWQSMCRALVMTRAGERCEWSTHHLTRCGKGSTAFEPVDWHHIAGRRNIVAEPWASMPALTVALCRHAHHAPCHNRPRGDCAVAVQEMGAENLAVWMRSVFGRGTVPLRVGDVRPTAVQYIRTLVRFGSDAMTDEALMELHGYSEARE